ncbi:Scr1 family TA system antitoxin-like transcriptional regulator [Streptomyces asiaticus]
MQHHASAICVYASATIPRIVQTTGCPVDLLTLRTTATQPPRISPHTVLPDQTRQDVTVILDESILVRTFAAPAAMATQMASQAARRRLAAGLAAAKDPQASAELLDIARRRFEQLDKDPDPKSDPLLEELTA